MLGTPQSSGPIARHWKKRGGLWSGRVLPLTGQREGKDMKEAGKAVSRSLSKGLPAVCLCYADADEGKKPFVYLTRFTVPVEKLSQQLSVSSNKLTNS